MKITYYPTHVRMGAWIVGILVGYILHQIRGRRVILSKVNIRLTSILSYFYEHTVDISEYCHT